MSKPVGPKCLDSICGQVYAFKARSTIDRSAARHDMRMIIFNITPTPTPTLALRCCPTPPPDRMALRQLADYHVAAATSPTDPPP